MIEVRLANFWHSGAQLVFTVPLPNSGPVFMKQSILPGERDTYAIVYVQSAKLVDNWRDGDRKHRTSLALPNTWVHDPKYAAAKGGFSRGAIDPVPIPDVGCRMEVATGESQRFFRSNPAEPAVKIPSYSPSGELGRTRWLLSMGCAAFPVRSHMRNGAYDLFAAFGVPGSRFLTIGELADSLPTSDPDLLEDA